MGRGGKVGCKPNIRRRVRSKGSGSDDSDEDYVVSDEKGVVSDDSEDCGSFLDGCASEESLGNCADEGEDGDEDYNDDEEVVEMRKVAGRDRRDFSAPPRKPAGRGLQKKKRTLDDDEDNDEDYDDEDDEEVVEEVRKVSRREQEDMLAPLRKPGGRGLQKRKRTFNDDDDEDEEENDEDYNEDEDEDEEEKEEEEEEEVKDVRKVARQEAGDLSAPLRKTGNRALKKRRRTFNDDEDEEDDDEDYDDADEEEEKQEEEEEEEEVVVKEVRKVARQEPGDFSATLRKTGSRASKKRRRTFNDEEDDDEDYDDADEEEEDEEFTPDEDDCLDEEEEFRATRKLHNKKVVERGSQRKAPVRGRQRKKSKPRVLKKPLQKKGRTRRLRRKVKSDNDDCSTSMDKKLVAREKSRKVQGRGRRRNIVQSDSDFVSSGSSDFEYTISEEEKEQIREASQLCGDMTANLRNSTSLKKLEEDSFLGQLKWPRRKGKEKVEEVKNELVKQICGICLTEEDKRRVRGTLDCCSHYFCFTCIMAWSKVETRCPLCKQRFHSISKPARLTAGTDLKNVVIQVPERDQVYQPSEEEIRSYFDPYENVLCTECHQGGDDALMLLCDSCDSPAHTYCVGLGQEVPEGNWYCEGCRPVALGSSSSQVQTRLPDQSMTNNFSNSLREGIDLNSLPSPPTTSAPGFGNFSSPRHSVVDGRGASPGSGGGAPTLSGRRWVHRQIQNLLALNRMTAVAGRGDGISVLNSSRDSLSSQINMGRETAFQPTRTQAIGVSNRTIFEERLPNNLSPAPQNMDVFSRFNQLRRQAIDNSDVAVTDRAINGTFWDRFAGMHSSPGSEQLNHCSSRPSIGSDVRVSPLVVREGVYLQKEKEQVQSMVKRHLLMLSRDIGLDHATLEDIARWSTHTILAACGLEEPITEVCIELQPFICPHIEIVAAGHASLMKGCCPSCFDSFGRDVVKKILNTKLPPWLVGTRL